MKKTRSLEIDEKTQFFSYSYDFLKYEVLEKIDYVFRKITRKYDKFFYDKIFLLKTFYSKEGDKQFVDKMIEKLVSNNLYTLHKILYDKDVDEKYVEKLINELNQNYVENLLEPYMKVFKQINISDPRFEKILQQSLSSPRKFGLPVLFLLHGDKRVIDFLADFVEKALPKNISIDVKKELPLLDSIDFVTKYGDVKIIDLIDNYISVGESNQELDKLIDFLSYLTVLDRVEFFKEEKFVEKVVEPLFSQKGVPEDFFQLYVSSLLRNIYEGIHKFDEYVKRLSRIASRKLKKEDLYFLVKPLGEIVHLDNVKLIEKIDDVEIQYEIAPTYVVSQQGPVPLSNIEITIKRGDNFLGKTTYDLMYPTQRRIFDENSPHILFDLVMNVTPENEVEINEIFRKLVENGIYILPIHRSILIVKGNVVKKIPGNEIYDLRFHGNMVRNMIDTGLSLLNQNRNTALTVFDEILRKISNKYITVYDSATVSVKCDSNGNCVLLDKISNTVEEFKAKDPRNVVETIDEILLNKYIDSDKHLDVITYLVQKYGKTLEKAREVLDAFREEYEMLENIRFLEFKLVNGLLTLVQPTVSSSYVIFDDPINFIKILNENRVMTHSSFNSRLLGIVEDVKSKKDIDNVLGEKVDYKLVEFRNLLPENDSFEYIEQINRYGLLVGKKLIVFDIEKEFSLYMSFIRKRLEVLEEEKRKEKEENKEDEKRKKFIKDGFIVDDEKMITVELANGEKKYYHVIKFNAGFYVVNEISPNDIIAIYDIK